MSRRFALPVRGGHRKLPPMCCLLLQAGPSQGGVTALEVIRTILAVGPLAVAALAIWGGWVRARLAGPRLTISLRSDRGYPTPRTDGTSNWMAIFFHLDVNNLRNWSPATCVRVMVEGLSKRGPDGSFVDLHVLPHQLTWMVPEVHERFPTLSGPDVCDLGFLDQHAHRFFLSPYAFQAHFPGMIGANEAMRVAVAAIAENGRSRQIFVEIAWDGEWTLDLDQLRLHLVVKEVPALT